MSGRKHSDKSKQIMSDAKKGKNNPNFGKNHTEETRTKISDAISGENHPNYGKNLSNETKSKISDAQKGKNLSEETRKKISDTKKGENNPNSQQIEVIDLKEITTTYYNSFREAARALNIPNHCIISNYIKNNQKKPYKGRYTFKKINS